MGEVIGGRGGHSRGVGVSVGLSLSLISLALARRAW